MALNTTASDHYLNLSGAQLVPTTASLTAGDNLTTVLAANAMMCVHGPNGLGKTLAVKANLRDQAPDHTIWLQLSSRSLPNIRTTLFKQLQLPGDLPTKVAPADDLLKEALDQQPHVLVCDEAQWLDTPGFEYFRSLWDTTTNVAVIFIGAENCYRKISNRPPLASRVLTWQQFDPLRPEEVLRAIPRFHPVWAPAEPEDLLWVDDLACHGNFRNWAKVTFHLQEALRRRPDETLNRELLGWVFSRLDSRARR
jgi:hypothetical protein